MKEESRGLRSYSVGKVRCWWHIVVGALIPWLSLQAGIALVILFCSYEYLQYRHHSTKAMRDDSYLDILEAAVACGISGAAQSILATFQILG